MMTTSLRYYAAACQTDLPNPRTRDEIHGQVDRMIAMIDHAVVGYAPFGPVRTSCLVPLAMCVRRPTICSSL